MLLQRTKSGGVRQRRFIFHPIRKSEACGHCYHCQNPALKQACIVRRREMQEAMRAAEMQDPDGQ